MAAGRRTEAPGPFDPGAQADPKAPCPPEDRENGIDRGRLQGLPTAVRVHDITAGKQFNIAANQGYHCEFRPRRR